MKCSESSGNEQLRIGRITADLTNVQCCYAESKHLVQPLKMRGLIIYLVFLQCWWYKSQVITQNMFCSNFLR